MDLEGKKYRPLFMDFKISPYQKFRARAAPG